MNPYQERVKAEQEQIHERVGKLHAFTRTNDFAYLDLEEKTLLLRQLRIMIEYETVLLARLELWKRKT